MKTVKLLWLLVFAWLSPVIVLAQVAAPVAVPAAPSFFAGLLASLTSGGVWSSVITVVSVVFGLWQNKAASTKQKVAQSLVKVIEAATKLPEVQALEGKIKAMATTEATALGVQDDLHTIVTQFTAQA